MLRTLRLRFADRPDLDLAVEPADGETDPWRLLHSQADDQGMISLGDRESCRIEDVLEATLVDLQPRQGPTFERGLQDEDIATALDENYHSPD